MSYDSYDPQPSPSSEPPPGPQPYGIPGGHGGLPTGPWFISRMGQEQGPLDLPQLQHLALTDQLRGDAMVRAESGQWFPAKQIPGLFSTREWLTTLLISIFVGGLGIDRFYLGQTGLGVAKLLTCGGCGVWSLVDIILIAMRKVQDVDGRPLA